MSIYKIHAKQISTWLDLNQSLTLIISNYANKL